MKIKRIKGYEIDNKIGQGSYGQVYKGHNSEGQSVAIKFISPRSNSQNQIIKQTMNMKKANCQTTVLHRKTFFNTQSGWGYIVMELCEGSLQQIYKEFSQQHLSPICKQIIQAVKEVHERGVCHRDIKLQNLLYKIDQETRDLKIKIGDFGASKKILLESPMRTNVGTEYYKPLEMMKAEQYTQKVDSWAVGIVILELWLKKRVNQFYNGGAVPALVDSFPSQAELSVIENQRLRKVTKKLLKKDPEERISIVDACRQLKKSQIVNIIPLILDTTKEQTNSNNSELQIILSPEQKIKQTLLKADPKAVPILLLMQYKLQKIPQQVFTLTHLIQLDLFDNELSYLPQQIGNLINLQKLNLSCNRLQKLPQTMNKLLQLSDLSMRDNKLTQFPQFIYLLPQIQYMIIYGNKFIVNPRRLLGLRKLKWMVLGKGQLQEEDLFLLDCSLGDNGAMFCGRVNLERLLK